MSSPERLLVVADFTADNLVSQLRRLDGLDVTAAPFDQVEPVLLGHTVDAWEPAPDWAFVWSRPERAVPAFARLLNHESVRPEEIVEDTARFAQLAAKASERVRALFVATWTLPPQRHGLGLLEMAPSHGPGAALLRMNLTLAEALADVPTAHALDAATWVARAGAKAYSPKLWYLNKTPFGVPVLKSASDAVAAAIAAVRGKARKLIVLDLDDTLWGGIVGDDGWENLKLGGHDPVGEALADFQRRLKALTARGLLLAIVSKNTEDVALEAIRRHPEMVLSETDFVGWRINWQDKAANIASLVADVGLGLQSVVFIDDNPRERSRVAEALPEVLVPEWPKNKLLYSQALEALDCFDTPSLTAEDRQRSEMYVAERQRRELSRELPSQDEWLASLGIEVAIEPYRPANQQRIVQLLNKTNQMNLATRRLTQAELDAWLAPESRELWAFRVADRYGDAGLCGILGLDLTGATGRVTDFVLSCRVIGRKVEQVMLAHGIERARARGATRLEARHLPTKKNRPCREFFESSGFASDGDTFGWPVADDYAVPDYVSVGSA